MAITFSALLKDKSFGLKTKKDIKELYDLVREEVFSKRLNLEGHSLPTTMNEWITLVEGDKKLLKRDVDVVDFSLANDEAYSAWKKALLRKRKEAVEASKTIYVSKPSHDIFVRIKELEQTQEASMQYMNGKKDDLVAALSDMQAASALLLQTYDKVAKSFKFPPRQMALTRVKVRKGKEA